MDRKKQNTTYMCACLTKLNMAVAEILSNHCDNLQTILPSFVKDHAIYIYNKF